MLAQVVNSTSSQGSSHSGSFFAVGLFIAVLLACMPATIASRKGRSFALWFLFGFLCFLPALIISLVVSDAPVRNALGEADFAAWSAEHGSTHGRSTLVVDPSTASWDKPIASPTPVAPAGWYPDPGGTPAQRFWSGTAWTDETR